VRLKKSMLAAVAGVVATALATGSAAARPADGPAAQTSAGSLQWANTATHRRPATFNDVASGAGGTQAVGGDQVDDFADQRPLAMRWDGKTWKATAQPVKTNATLESVAFGTAANVWVVGADRTDPNKTTGTPVGSGNRSTPASRSR
jgi:hypothetical protein